MARKKSRKKSRQPHKQQARGFLLLGVALILLLAILSFDVHDPVTLSGPGAVLVHNWFGRVGAVIAYYLMQWTLGYPILILPLILGLWALEMILDQRFRWFRSVTYSLIIWGFMASVFLAMPEALRTNGQIAEYYPSGLIGGWVASKLVLYLGSFGSITLLVILTLTLLILSVQLEIAPAFAFVSNVLASVAAFAKRIWQKIRGTRHEKIPEPEVQPEVSRPEKEESPEIFLPDMPEVIEKENEQETPEFFPPEGAVLSPTPGPEEADQDEKDLFKDVPPEGGIQTDLDSLLRELEEAEGTKSSEPPVKEEQPVPLPEEKSGGETLDFEVQEEVQDKELDYDRLVKESIARYEFPSIDLLNDPPKQKSGVTEEELKTNADLLESRLAEFGIKAKVIRVTAGPVITLYELQPAPGVKVSSIVALANDLALAMEARGIRIIAPIPGKAAVGIEIPNRHPQMVYLKTLIRSEKFATSNYELPIALGKTISGESYIADLTKMPHLLVAGATGSGKSVGINTILMSLMYAVNPAKVKFMLVDPKKIELSIYRDLQDHYLIWRPDLDEVVSTKPSNTISMLNSMVLEMERRYDMLSEIRARNIVEFNAKVRQLQEMAKDGKTRFTQLPYIVIVIDELADLILVAAKEVETPIARLAQKARAVGIHLIVATQRPSVDVITGVIKANFPARIAYLVHSKTDSRTILDMNGADQLLGNGDMLFQPPGVPKPIRLQNPFVSTEEVERVVGHISKQPKMPYYSIPQPGSASAGGSISGGAVMERDPLYEEARAIVVRHQQGSISFLQRRLKIGFSRAARIMDELERDGVVGPAEGSKPREVLITLQELQQMMH
jgi:S-DNA-T family DNA segregation ATPase FtsK/SpoIIIE